MTEKKGKDIHKETAELSFEEEVLKKVSKGCKLIDGKLVHKTVEVQGGMAENFRRIYGGKNNNEISKS